MIKIIACKFNDLADIQLKFSDGLIGNFDLHKYLLIKSGSLLDPLKDPDYARRVFIDAGGLSWPNGLSLSPERLRDLIRSTVVSDNV